MEDPVEVLFPSRDRLFVVLRVEELKNRMPFTLLDDPPLDFGHSSAIGTRGDE